MIGRLRGEILGKYPPLLLLDVNGVGYELEAPMSTFYALPEVGETVTLVTHLGMRDETPVLYGFLTRRDRALFRDLLKVNGVGARMALGVLSGMNAQQFVDCIAREDWGALTSLPGIGRKTAQRLVMEFKDQAAASADADVTPAHPGTGRDRQRGLDDAISALIALGYRSADASRMAHSAAASDAMTSEEIIRAALKAVNDR